MLTLNNFVKDPNTGHPKPKPRPRRMLKLDIGNYPNFHEKALEEASKIEQRQTEQNLPPANQENVGASTSTQCSSPSISDMSEGSDVAHIPMGTTIADTNNFANSPNFHETTDETSEVEQNFARQENIESSSSTEYSSPNEEPVVSIQESGETMASVAPSFEEISSEEEMIKKIDKKHHLIDKWKFEVEESDIEKPGLLKRLFPDTKGTGSYGKVQGVKAKGHDVVSKSFHNGDAMSLERELLMNLILRRHARYVIDVSKDVFYFKCLKYLVACHSTVKSANNLTESEDRPISTEILDQLEQIIDENNLPPIYFQEAKGLDFHRCLLNGSYDRISSLDKVKALKRFCMGMSMLDAAHIVHGDIKGNNIKIYEKNRPVIFDLGISIYSKDIFTNGNYPVVAHYCASPELREVYERYKAISEEREHELEEREHELDPEWERVLGPEGGPKCNAYAIGVMIFAFLFGEEGYGEITIDVFTCGNLDPRKSLSLKKINDEYQSIHNKAGKKFDELNEKAGFPYAPQQSEILKEVVCGLLHPDPKERWTAKDAVDALKVVIEDMKQKQWK